MIEIKILGLGCPNCIKSEKLCIDVSSKNKFDALITKVTENQDIFNLAIIKTHRLIVNAKILLSDKFKTKSTLIHLLTNATLEK